jgi:hypothetical protein
VQTIGEILFENLIVDLTEIPQARGYKYLLVLVCTFSGWMEAFPTQTERTQEVARFLLKELIPQFGIPVSIGLDNEPAFVAEVVQLVAKGLRIT